MSCKTSAFNWKLKMFILQSDTNSCLFVFDLFVSDVDPAEFFFLQLFGYLLRGALLYRDDFPLLFCGKLFDLFIAGTAVDTQNLIGGFDVIVIHGFYGHESDMIDAQPVEMFSSRPISAVLTLPSALAMPNGK